MGVEPFLISSTLEAVLGQRLLRSICRQCRTTYKPSDSLLAELGSRGRTLAKNNSFAVKVATLVTTQATKDEKESTSF
jgi:type II secretory ATPase GspE/PulE/Tfp pilus assembly ATPase PilB-like protein